MSCRVVLCRVVSCRAMSYRTVPYHIVSYRIVSSRRVASRRVISYHIISYHIYHIISYQIKSYQIKSNQILYNIISYHAITQHLTKERALCFWVFVILHISLMVTSLTTRNGRIDQVSVKPSWKIFVNKSDSHEFAKGCQFYANGNNVWQTYWTRFVGYTLQLKDNFCHMIEYCVSLKLRVTLSMFNAILPLESRLHRQSWKKECYTHLW